MKTTKITAAIYGAVVLMPGFLLVEPSLGNSADPVASQGRSIEVPFELHGHLAVVEGSVNGLGNLNMIIDTGNTVTVISREPTLATELSGECCGVLGIGPRS